VEARPTIVIADDEPLIREVLRKVLQATLPCELIEVADGVAALRAVRSVRPVLAILDEQMPGLTGSAVCRCLKTDPATAHIPILLFTGALSEAEAEAVGRVVEADGVFRKPHGLRALGARVQELVGALVPSGAPT
jgi:CheY-like chemotaxis protein